MVVEEQVGRSLRLSDADDETKYYEAHLNEFQQPEQIQLSEILIPLPETATPEQIAQAEKKANGVKSQVMAGGRVSRTWRRSIPGDLRRRRVVSWGCSSGERWRKVLEEQTFGSEAGRVDAADPDATGAL